MYRISDIYSTGEKEAWKYPNKNTVYCLGEEIKGQALLFISSHSEPLHKKMFEVCYTPSCENYSTPCSCYDFSSVSSNFVLFVYYEFIPEQALHNTVCYKSIRSLKWRIQVPLGPNVGEFILLLLVLSVRSMVVTLNNVTVPVGCSIPEDPENGRAECPNGLSGECACTYTCSDGYAPLGHPCIRCENNDSWNPNPMCNSKPPTKSCDVFH